MLTLWRADNDPSQFKGTTVNELQFFEHEKDALTYRRGDSTSKIWSVKLPKASVKYIKQPPSPPYIGWIVAYTGLIP
jgi:hypothetical protein